MKLTLLIKTDINNKYNKELNCSILEDDKCHGDKGKSRARTGNWVWKASCGGWDSPRGSDVSKDVKKM